MKTTGMIFWIGNGIPPPVILNKKKYKNSFFLNNLINFSIFVESFSFIISLKNVLNEKYNDAFNYSTPGRTFDLNLVTQF